MIEIEEIISDDEGTPIIGIAVHEDGGYSFQTSLTGPEEMLWVLEAVKRQILEEAFG